MSEARPNLDDLEWEYEYDVDDGPESSGVGEVLRRVAAYGPWERTGTFTKPASELIGEMKERNPIPELEG